MGFLDRLFGRRETPSWTPGPIEDQPALDEPSEDERAVERYRYLLRTAPPETIEEAHAEAFAQLTPEQRRMVLDELSRELPEHERGGASSDDPRSLARLATRAEMRQPGTLERSFGGMSGRGVGFGGMLAGSFFSAFAGVLIGSAIAQQFFYDDAGAGAEGDDSQSDGDGDGDADAGDVGDAGGDYGGGDFGGGDFGGGF